MGGLTECMAETERPSDDAQAQHASLLLARPEDDTGDDPDGGIGGQLAGEEGEGSTREGEPPSRAEASKAAACAFARRSRVVLVVVQRCMRACTDCRRDRLGRSI